MYGYGYSLYNRLAFLGGLDPNASAFLTATGITDPTITNAVNSLCIDLKKYGVWSKMKAIYPFCGGTPTTHKFNLKDARDLDAAFRLAFSGGWTHNSNGVTPNGVNAFANTFFNPRTSLTIGSNSQGQYQRLNAIDSGFRGVWDNTTAFRFEIVVNGATFANRCKTTANGSEIEIATIADTRGLILSKSQGGQFKFLRNSSIMASTTAGSTIYPNRPYYLAALNNNGTPAIFSNMPLSFSFLGDGLTDEDSANLYYSVQKFQTTLGRQVGTPIYSSNATDVNARLFLGATNIQDVTITSAVDTLVQGLKTDGVWTKLKAVYPFVGGTPTTHKFNLANALDEDTSFRLAFSGGWTHSSNGALPNGTNGYANTFLNLNTLTNNSTHLSYYSRINTAGSTRVEIGGGSNAAFTHLRMLLRRISGNYNGDQYFDLTGLNRIDFPVSSSQGYFIDSRINNLTHKAFRSNTLIGSESYLQSNNISSVNSNIFIGAGSNTGTAELFSDRQCAFATIGDGLTDTEASNLYTRVQAFQTTLSRNI
jgi:hypothetical protein